MAEIITIYKPGGLVEKKPQGYPGSTCHDATRPYDEARCGEHCVVEGEGAPATPVQQQARQRA